jgi:pimeloyl-ACP methyl ester carboxylesterase
VTAGKPPSGRAESRDPPRRPPAAGPTVVFLPGVGLDVRSWTAVRAGVTAPSVVVSLPSMGRRAGADADLHVEAHARRVLAALPAEGDVILVGHSAGCPVAVEVAALEPRVLALVLVGPVTDPQARSWPRMLAHWLRTAVHESLWELKVLAPQYRRTGWRSMLRGMTQVRRYRTDVGLSRLRVRTCVIRGQRDRVASERWCTELTKNPLAELVSVPQAAHMIPLTHPNAVVDAIEHLARSGVDQRVGSATA